MENKMNELTDTPEYKLCPFCGSDASISISEYGVDVFYVVKCQGVGCYALGPVRTAKKKAIKLWNDRF